MDVIVFTDKKSIEDNKFNPEDFCNKLVEASEGNINCEYSCYEDILFRFDFGAVQLYDNRLESNLEYYDVAYFKRADNLPLVANSVALALNSKGVKVIDSEHITQGGSDSSSKVLEHTLMSLNRIKTPVSYSAMLSTVKSLVLQKSNLLPNYPCVIKLAVGTRGEFNFLVNNDEELDRLQAPEGFYIVQEYIPNDCDYRLFVTGDKCGLIIKRTRRKDSKTHTNNTSTGAKSEIVESEEMNKLLIKEAVDAAHKMNRQVAGVDLLIDKKTEEGYILEVNRSPQTESGSFVGKKMSLLANYLSELK